MISHHRHKLANRWTRVGRLLLSMAALATTLLAQQSPWGTAAQRMATELTGPVAKALSLVAVVVGGLTIAFNEGHDKRTIGAIIFGLGMALGANIFVAWLFN